MSVYSIAVYLHIVGALALFAGLGVGWAGLLGLRGATTVARAADWARLLGGLRRVEGPAALLVLATGVYLGVTQWGHQPWIVAGVLGLVAMGVLGGALTGRRVAAIVRATPREDGAIPAALRARLHDPVLRLSMWLRTTLALGIVFVMSVKPDAAATSVAIGVALAAGLAVGYPARSAGRGSALGPPATDS